MAYILARGTRYRSGDELLANIEPWEWGRLKASYKLDPYGDDWDRTSLSTAEIINAIMAVARGLGGDKSRDCEPLPSDAFVPWRHSEEREADVDEALEGLEALRGL